MNSFAVLSLDSDDEDNTQQKKGNQSKGQADAKKAAPKPEAKPVVGAPANAKPAGKAQNPKAAASKPVVQPPIAAASKAAEPAATEDIADVDKERSQGARKHHVRYGSRGGQSGTNRAHPKRHEYDRTGKGKEGARGGRGPGGWGNAGDEAHDAEKHGVTGEEAPKDTENVNPAEESVAEGAEAVAPTEEAAPAEPEGPKVFTLDEYMARRNASRNDDALFGNVQERRVVADNKLKVLAKEGEDEDDVNGKNSKGAAGKTQRSTKAQVLEANYVVKSTAEKRDRDGEDRRGGREGGRGGGRFEGRGGRGGRDRDFGGRSGGRSPAGGRGGGRGSNVALHMEEFPAL